MTQNKLMFFIWLISKNAHKSDFCFKKCINTFFLFTNKTRRLNTYFRSNKIIISRKIKLKKLIQAICLCKNVNTVIHVKFLMLTDKYRRHHSSHSLGKVINVQFHCCPHIFLLHLALKKKVNNVSYKLQ